MRPDRREALGRTFALSSCAAIHHHHRRRHCRTSEISTTAVVAVVAAVACIAAYNVARSSAYPRTDLNQVESIYRVLATFFIDQVIGLNFVFYFYHRIFFARESRGKTSALGTRVRERKRSAPVEPSRSRRLKCHSPSTGEGLKLNRALCVNNALSAFNTLNADPAAHMCIVMCRICDETPRCCGELRHAHTNDASVIDGLLPNVHSIGIAIWPRRDAVCITQHECTQQWTPRLSLGFIVRVQGQGYAIVRLRTTSTTSTSGSGSGSSFCRARETRASIYTIAWLRSSRRRRSSSSRHYYLPLLLLLSRMEGMRDVRIPGNACVSVPWMLYIRARQSTPGAKQRKMTTTNNTSHTPEGLQAEVRSAIRVLHGWCPRPPQQQQQQQQQIQPPPPPPPLPQQQQHQGPINRGETVLMPPQRPPRPAGSVVVSSTSNGSNGSIVVSSNGVVNGVNGIGGPGAVGSPAAANLVVTNGNGSSSANNPVPNGGSIISGVTVNGGSSSSSSSGSSTNGASSAANVSNNNSNNSMRPPPPPPPRNRNSSEGKAHHEEPTSSIPDLDSDCEFIARLRRVHTSMICARARALMSSKASLSARCAAQTNAPMFIMQPIRVTRDPPVVSYSRAMFSTLDTEKEKKKREASLGFVRNRAHVVAVVFRHAAHDVYKVHSTHKPWAMLPFIIIHAYYKSSAHNKSMARHTGGYARFLMLLAELLSCVNERERFNCIESERRCAREEAESSYMLDINDALLRAGSSNSAAVAAAAVAASELLKVRVHSVATAVAADCNLDPERCSSLATSKKRSVHKTSLIYFQYTAKRASRSKSSENRSLLRSRSPECLKLRKGAAAKRISLELIRIIDETCTRVLRACSTATAAAVAAVTLASMSKRKRMPQIAGGQRANEREHRPMACRGQTLEMGPFHERLEAPKVADDMFHISSCRMRIKGFQTYNRFTPHIGGNFEISRLRYKIFDAYDNNNKNRRTIEKYIRAAAAAAAVFQRSGPASSTACTARQPTDIPNKHLLRSCITTLDCISSSSHWLIKLRDTTCRMRIRARARVKKKIRSRFHPICVICARAAHRRSTNPHTPTPPTSRKNVNNNTKEQYRQLKESEMTVQEYKSRGASDGAENHHQTGSCCRQPDILTLSNESLDEVKEQQQQQPPPPPPLPPQPQQQQQQQQQQQLQQLQQHRTQDSENLLGRVLAARHWCASKRCSGPCTVLARTYMYCVQFSWWIIPTSAYRRSPRVDRLGVYVFEQAVCSSSSSKPVVLILVFLEHDEMVDEQSLRVYIWKISYYSNVCNDRSIFALTSNQQQQHQLELQQRAFIRCSQPPRRAHVQSSSSSSSSECGEREWPSSATL
ncbi:unnamed protein product [Trichogramma brassicae]|uniref:Uncharacterized protein n=1 Tax=Trichogramma brassicae TaxID=86971 RepID=A0A6H5IV51_9HYME|nr:unnamed protein product [Trichogramma brassicae]